MIAIGMGLAFGAYTLAVWGYCLVRGYNVPLSALFKTTWPGKGKTAAAKDTAVQAA